MDNRILNKYGAYGSTEIGQEIAAVTEDFEKDLKRIIDRHALSIPEQHTLQHIVLSTVQCMVAENTLRTGLRIRQEERKLNTSTAP
jgi:hypothetical protein